MDFRRALKSQTSSPTVNRHSTWRRGLNVTSYRRGVVTLAEVIDQALYYEEVQQLAREHGLPVSRSKDELIDELVSSGELDPEEVVAFVRVDMLRVFLQEMGLPSGASRDVLAARLVEALGSRPQAKGRPRQSRTKTGPALSDPSAQGSSSVESKTQKGPTGPVAPTPIALQVHVPPNPPPIVEVYFPKPERPSAAWGFAGVLMAGIVGATLYVSVASLGLEGGALTTVVVATVLAVVLLFTARWWVPWIDGLAK